jgi:predicted RNA-binding protein with RPS1 domain
MSHPLTKDMLANALQRLDAIQGNESAPVENEQLKQRAMEVAELALQSIALCVKYMLAHYGESAIEGLGSLLLQDGRIEFTPDSDVLQYALLKHQDEVSLQQALREAFVVNLTLAHSILPLMDLTQNLDVVAPVELTAEERFLRAMFKDTTPNHFDRAVSAVISSIIHDLHSAGVDVKLSYEMGVPRRSVKTGFSRITLDEIGDNLCVSAEEAAQTVSNATRTAEVGKTYLGKVVRIAEFGAFVELFPGTDGLLHISEISEHRIRDARDKLKLGDQVLVKVLAMEGNKIRLSHKAVLKEKVAASDSAEIATETGGDTMSGEREV